MSVNSNKLLLPHPDLDGLCRGAVMSQGLDLLE